MKDHHKQTLKRCIRHASEYGPPSNAVNCNGIFRICGNCPEKLVNERKLATLPWFFVEQAS